MCIVFRVAPVDGGTKSPSFVAGFAGYFSCFDGVVHGLVDLLC